MNKYEARWLNAVKQAKAIKAKCNELGEGYLLTFQDMFINEDNLQIQENRIIVVDGTCVYGVYTDNPKWDEGSQDTIKQTNQSFRRDFKIMQEVEW